jgi:hypothetical protein
VGDHVPTTMSATVPCASSARLSIGLVEEIDRSGALYAHVPAWQRNDEAMANSAPRGNETHTAAPKCINGEPEAEVPPVASVGEGRQSRQRPRWRLAPPCLEDEASAKLASVPDDCRTRRRTLPHEKARRVQQLALLVPAGDLKQNEERRWEKRRRQDAWRGTCNFRRTAGAGCRGGARRTRFLVILYLGGDDAAQVLDVLDAHLADAPISRATGT